MKIRDLTRSSGGGGTAAPIWPPRGASSSGGARALPGDGTLESVEVVDQTSLRLTMKHGSVNYTAILTLDTVSMVLNLERILKANLGKEIGVIGDLDI